MSRQKQKREMPTIESTSVIERSEQPSKRSKSLSETSEPHIRDIINKYKVSPDRPSLKIISWNVNGLKALISNNKLTLDNLIALHKPDVLCLQETKLQEDYVDQYDNIIPGYQTYWSCSTEKKGYAGTAIFLNKSSFCFSKCDPPTSNGKGIPQKNLRNFFKSKKDEESAPSNIEDASTLLNIVGIYYDFDNMERFLPGEGRTITIETEKFFLVACYVPNSGEGLTRLKFRVEEWDPFVRRYLEFLLQRKPVIFTGDMNVGHKDIDIHNPTAKHIVKQAGLTPAERDSFSNLLSDGNFVDAFRYFYPSARGQFTYWSQRTFARPVNKGLRLDYFICSSNILPARTSVPSCENHSGRSEVETSMGENYLIRDSYIIHDETVGCSDHCPIVLIIQ